MVQVVQVSRLVQLAQLLQLEELVQLVQKTFTIKLFNYSTDIRGLDLLETFSRSIGEGGMCSILIRLMINMNKRGMNNPSRCWSGVKCCIKCSID